MRLCFSYAVFHPLNQAWKPPAWHQSPQGGRDAFSTSRPLRFDLHCEHNVVIVGHSNTVSYLQPCPKRSIRQPRDSSNPPASSLSLAHSQLQTSAAAQRAVFSEHPRRRQLHTQPIRPLQHLHHHYTEATGVSSERCPARSSEERSQPFGYEHKTRGNESPLLRVQGTMCEHWRNGMRWASR